MTDNLTNNVLKDIENQHITPRPRWQVITGRTAWWITLMLMSMLGTLAAAATLFQIQAADWPFLWQTDGWVRLFIWSLPYWWLGIVTITAVLAYFAIRHLPRGYRYRVPFVIAGFFIVISLAGWGLHALRFGGRAVNAWGNEFLPFHAAMQAHHQQLWIQPQGGLLAGEVIGTAPDVIMMRDFNGQEWELLAPASTTMPLFKRNERIRIIGDPLPDTATGTPRRFRVKRTAPWEGLPLPPGKAFERKMMR